MDHLLLLESGTPDSLLLEDGFDLLLESSTLPVREGTWWIVRVPRQDRTVVDPRMGD